MNRKETRILERHIEALRVCRAFLEPHNSWESTRLRREALKAIRETIGSSTPRFDDFYDRAPEIPG